MVTYTNLSNLIYFGNFPELDTDEGASGYEGSTAPIIGTSLSGPAANANVVSFDYDDVDNDGLFESDHNGSSETITVAGVASVVDKIVIASVLLTLPGGATQTTSVIGYQLVNGDFYLSDFLNRIEGKSVYSLEITGITNTPDSGSISAFQGGGTYDLDSFTFVSCFAAETLILTEHGERPVRSLAIEDLVFTADDGLQPIRWISQSTQNWDSAPHKDKPIKFSAGSLGAGLPRRDLRVSPQHRMLIADPHVPEGVFAPAKKLTSLKGVRQMSGSRQVDYIHLMFDAHQVLFAEGAPTESFFPGRQSLKTLNSVDRLRLHRLFPHLSQPNAYPPARRILQNRESYDRARAGIGPWTDKLLSNARISHRPKAPTAPQQTAIRVA